MPLEIRRKVDELFFTTVCSFTVENDSFCSSQVVFLRYLAFGSLSSVLGFAGLRNRRSTHFQPYIVCCILVMCLI